MGTYVYIHEWRRGAVGGARPVMAGAAGGKPPAATRPETQPYSQWLGDVIYVRRDDARRRQPARKRGANQRG